MFSELDADTVISTPVDSRRSPATLDRPDVNRSQVTVRLLGYLILKLLNKFNIWKYF